MNTSANPCSSLDFFAILCTLTSENFGVTVSTIINLVFIVAILIAVFYLIYGGIKWIMSRGNKEQVEAARNHIVATVIGLSIVFLAFLIVNLVLGFFFPGKSIKDLSLPTLAPDTTPPAVSITAPSSDSTVSGTASIQVTASDNKEVAKVEFYADNVLKSTIAKPPYQFAWDTKSYKHNSIHTLLAKAYDPSKNIGTSSSVNVVVIDVTKPSVAITSPANQAIVTPNTITSIIASASDISGIAQVEFRVNGISKCTLVKIPYICSWQVPITKGVIYRIETLASDTAGNVGNASSSVTSQNSP